MNDILERTYFHNTVQEYLIVTGGILGAFLLIWAFKKWVISGIEKLTAKTKTKIDDYLVRSLDRYGIPALYITAVYAGVRYLVLSDRLGNILDIAITVAVTILLIRFVSSLILSILQSYIIRSHHHQGSGEEKVKQLGGIMLLINIFIWLIGILFLFDNFGYDVTTMVAGLGIGGIAVALAAQNILGDLFNYFVIFLDRPFEVGDYLIVDDKSGVVEKIGVKTTRVKTLTGDQLVFSNSDLSNSRIHNYKKMEKRRVLFKIGVIYQTSLEHLKEIPDIFKTVIEEQEMAEFDRAHFIAYAESSLDFEVVYYILNPDFLLYRDVHQAVNLRIFEEFSRRGIIFAYPTRTLFVSHETAEEGEKAPTADYQG